MKNMNKLLKQAQQMQAKMMQAQSELGSREVEASSGGGMVKAKVNGNMELLSLKIEPEVVNPDYVEMLEDLILAAVNEAVSQARTMMESEMGKLTGNIKIPGLF